MLSHFVPAVLASRLTPCRFKNSATSLSLSALVFPLPGGVTVVTSPPSPCSSEDPPCVPFRTACWPLARSETAEENATAKTPYSKTKPPRGRGRAEDWPTERALTLSSTYSASAGRRKTVSASIGSQMQPRRIWAASDLQIQPEYKE
nr:hypothetical protein Iba_chr02bCG24760 [Ipomoea batatas]